MQFEISPQNQSATRSNVSEASFPADSLLTVQEVAALLKVPVSWVYERTRRRGNERLPHVKVGKYVRFRPCEIQAYLETLRCG